MKKQQKTLLFWAVVVLFTLLIMREFGQGQRSTKQITYSQFVDAVEQSRVSEVTFKGQDTIMGKFKETYENGIAFELTGNTGDETFKFLRNNGIIPNYEKEEQQGMLASILISWFPMILLFVIFFLFMKQLQAGGGKAMSFGKAKAKMFTEHDKRVTFSDVAGVEEAKEELVEVVDFLKDPRKYTALGGKIPKGVILVGPPGTGKTLLARAVAGEAGVPFFSISGSDFVEMFVGVGASRVRDLFENGKKHAPCIIFIDEIDAVGRHRGAGMGGGHDEREQTLNQLLVEMDGFESNEGVILVAATNRIDVLDSALLRPGRFDRRVTVGRPDVRGRLGILKVHTNKSPLGDDVNLENIAKGTPGFTGADLANLVNEAALIAARSNKKKINNIDFERAKDKILMGVERKSMVISDKEKKNTAYHEVGHTIVAAKLPHTDPVHKVSIIPRGGALGVTVTLPQEDVLSYSRERITNQIAMLMGGRVAEEIIFNEYTSGAANDIERATELARNMVCHWGMSESMGPINYGQSQTQPFGGPMAGDNNFSESTAQKIDTEVATIITKAHALAKKILEDNIEALHKMSEALIVWETLDGEQVTKIMNGEDIGVPMMPESETQKPEVKTAETTKKDTDTSIGGEPEPA